MSKKMMVQFSFFIYCIAMGIVLLFCALCCDSRADELTDADIYRQVAITALLIGDMGQTLDSNAKRTHYRELNPYLRNHDTPSEIRQYFAVAIVGSAVVTKLLPAEYRPYWQYGLIGIEVAMLLQNKRVGLRFKF